MEQTTQIRTNRQSQILHAMLKARGLMDDKAEIVSGCTDGRTTSTAELTVKEAADMIIFLANDNMVAYARYDFNNKAHRKILSLCHELRWETPAGKVDLNRLGFWLAKYGKFHKPLNEYTQQELPQLITQMEQILHKNYDK